jgi:ABC-2 type transport system ATP-binding protein
MNITLKNIGKRFNREWIFRNINYHFESGKKYAITGSNGSGKSTLLQVIAGSLMHNEGTVEIADGRLTIDDRQLRTDNHQPSSHSPLTSHHSQNHYSLISLAAPYLELIEEMTALEFLKFHATFKPLTLSTTEILQIVN